MSYVLLLCLLLCAPHAAQAIREPNNQERSAIQREFEVATSADHRDRPGSVKRNGAAC